MIQVGVKESDKKWESGNQYQNCEKTNSPTIVGMWFCPARDWRETVVLRPPKMYNIKKPGYFTTKNCEHCSKAAISDFDGYAGRTVSH